MTVNVYAGADINQLPPELEWLVLLTRSDFQKYTGRLFQLTATLKDHEKLFGLINSHRLLVPVIRNGRKAGIKFPGFLDKMLEAFYRICCMVMLPAASTGIWIFLSHPNLQEKHWKFFISTGIFPGLKNTRKANGIIIKNIVRKYC